MSGPDYIVDNMVERFKNGGSFNFARHLADQIEWSRRVFGPEDRTEGVLRHIEKELSEIRQKPDDIDEWIDVIILACDGALRRGFTPLQIVSALDKKMKRNMERTWPDWRSRSSNEPIEHVKEPSHDVNGN
jgi:hypothetical protein